MPKTDAPEKDKPKRSSVVEDNLMLNVLKRYFKLAGGVSAVWLFGYFGLSVSWLWILLVPYVWKERLRKARQHRTAISQEMARDEKSVILARVEDLPSWVNFPDVERAEWVNKIIRQMWPYIGEMVEKILRESVEPSIKKSLPSALQSFTFSAIDLGDIPPRIGGVKVYSQLKRDEIYMDLEINYSSDCNIAVSIKGINAGIKDLRLHGTLRVVFKPLINKPPLIAGMRVFFLNNPELDFDLTSLANAFDLPGLSDMLHSIIMEQIANIMVLPNCIPIKLAEGLDLNKLKYPQPQGVVRVKVVEAKDLVAADISLLGKGKSDPYVVLKVGAKTVKTEIVNNSLNPVWNQSFEMIVDSADGQLLYIDVFDDDPGSKDDELGRVNMDMAKLRKDGYEDEWLPLEDVKQGLIHMQLTWLWLASDRQELRRVVGQVEQEVRQGKDLDENNTHVAMLIVFLDSAMNLPRGKKSLEEPSPQATLTVGQQVMESAVKQDTNEPRWEQNFRFMLKNPGFQNLEVEIKDSKSSQSIGKTQIKLKELIEAEDMEMDQKFHIKTSEPDAYVNMRLALRALTPRQQPDSMDEQEDMIDGSANNNEGEEAGTSVDQNKRAVEEAPQDRLRSAPSSSKESKEEAPSKNERVEEIKQKTQEELDADVMMENEPKQEDPTLFPADGFNPEADCDVLANAMKGSGTDEAAIISILSRRSQAQRKKIADYYKTKYGKELSKDLSSKLKGNFKTICVDMLMGPAEFDAKQLNKAMKGLGSDEQVLVEIICTRTNEQLNNIKAAYKTMFNKELEADVESDTSGDFQQLLLGCLQANRPEGTEFDRIRARKDAQDLLEAGEKNWGTNESSFQKILVSRSYAQLRATFQEYAKLANKDIEDSIKSEMSGDVKKGMLAIVGMIRGKASYFAKTLQKSMKGMGTDDDTLVRVVASRCEVDMVQIKEEFQKEFKQTLGMFITDDTTGDYRKMLLVLIGDETAEPEVKEKKEVKEARKEVKQEAVEAAGEVVKEIEPKPAEQVAREVDPSSAQKVSAKANGSAVEEVKQKTEEQLDADVQLESEPPESDPTLLAAEGFNPEADCDVLAKAMKGFGTDEAAIINVFSKRSQSQRQEIAAYFKAKYGKELSKELSSKLKGNFKSLCVDMVMGPAEFDANQLYKAMKGIGSDEQVLVEIICTRTNEQLNNIKAAYQTIFNKDLEANVVSDTSGDFQRVLVGCLQANRPEGTEFDRNRARREAQELLVAGEKNWGTQESTFQKILLTRSYAQLRATFQEYAKLANKDIEDSIRSEMSGDVKKAMLAIVGMIRGKANYFAKALQKSMKGIGTDDDTLVRIVASRCEVDMVQIKEEFQKEFKQTLGMYIYDDTTGDYRKMLLAMIGDENPKKK